MSSKLLFAPNCSRPFNTWSSRQNTDVKVQIFLMCFRFLFIISSMVLYSKTPLVYSSSFTFSSLQPSFGLSSRPVCFVWTTVIGISFGIRLTPLVIGDMSPNSVKNHWGTFLSNITLQLYLKEYAGVSLYSFTTLKLGVPGLFGRQAAKSAPLRNHLFYPKRYTRSHPDFARQAITWQNIGYYALFWHPLDSKVPVTQSRNVKNKYMFYSQSPYLNSKNTLQD